jgi:hypothetical protein
LFWLLQLAVRGGLQQQLQQQQLPSEDGFGDFFLLVVVVVCYALLCLQLFQTAFCLLLQLQIVGE